MVVDGLGAEQGPQRLQAWEETLTFVGAKAVLAVLLKVVGGRAPQEAVTATCVCAAGVFAAIEEEGELAVLPVGIPVLHADH